MSPTHTRKGNRLYRYYVSRDVLKRGPEVCPIGRVPAAEIEGAVIDQLRGIFRQPEIIVGTWRGARTEQDDVSEGEAREALTRLDPLWTSCCRASRRGSCWSSGWQCKYTVEVRPRPNRHAGLVHGARDRRHHEGAREAGDGPPGWRDDHRLLPDVVQKGGGRKLVVTPDGAEWAPRPRVDSAMLKALARASRWRKMLDTGQCAALEDLARAKGVPPSYASRILRLTLLAPGTVEAILDGRQPAELPLDDLLKGFPLGWERAGATGRLAVRPS